MCFGDAIVGNQTTLPPIARQRLTACGLRPPTCVFSAMPPNTSIPLLEMPCSRSAATSMAVSWWWDFTTIARMPASAARCAASAASIRRGNGDGYGCTCRSTAPSSSLSMSAAIDGESLEPVTHDPVRVVRLDPRLRLAGQRTAHREPVHDLDRLGAAELD